MPTKQLHYQVYGRGPQAVLAFHGFGQDASVFADFVQVFPDCTIYSFDLFFHGASHWAGSLHELDAGKWGELLQAFLTEHRVTEFALLGYSMGGRLALVTYLRFPAQVREIVLIAPDGIRPNAWYRLATRVPALHGAFRYLTAEQPNSLHYVMGKMRHWRLLPRTLLKIAETQMSQPALRARVYRTWMLFRFLEPDLRQLAQRWRQRPIRLRIFTGQADTVIRPTDMRPLLRCLPASEHVVLPCGHSRLLPATLAHLQSVNFGE
jgi:pimeloyl-ACP methyl ester carboxylesterase